MNIDEIYICNFSYFFYLFKNDGALGQTRTGTPKRARILSPLCLPISPRGHVLIFIVIVSILIHKTFEEVKKNYFPSLSPSLHLVFPYFIGQ